MQPNEQLEHKMADFRSVSSFAFLKLSKKVLLETVLRRVFSLMAKNAVSSKMGILEQKRIDLNLKQSPSDCENSPKNKQICAQPHL